MMMTKTDVSFFFDAMLSVPGMNENVRVDQKISRKQVLLISQLIRQGLAAPEGMAKELLSVLPKEMADQVARMATEMLEKAGLAELESKLKTFSEK